MSSLIQSFVARFLDLSPQPPKPSECACGIKYNPVPLFVTPSRSDSSEYSIDESPSPFNLLNEDLITFIFSFLTPQDLCICSFVSRKFHELADSDSLWMKLCIQRWQGKQTTPMSTKWALKLAASPEQQGTWKRAYIECEVDSNRLVITREELIGLKWEFRLHWDTNNENTINPTFDEDNIYSHHPPLRKLPWVLTSDGLVRVGHYPFLIPVHNTSDWSWHMSNDFVHFRSLGFMGKDDSEQLKDVSSPSSMSSSSS
mmetsp:Transcript_21659/g.35843  ORF Transcript_21659/g.35843 Transcript_21659/m.35843 type:complete len:257 (-) Transcript_21659:88-858(-)